MILSRTRWPASTSSEPAARTAGCSARHRARPACEVCSCGPLRANGLAHREPGRLDLDALDDDRGERHVAGVVELFTGVGEQVEKGSRPDPQRRLTTETAAILEVVWRAVGGCPGRGVRVSWPRLATTLEELVDVLGSESKALADAIRDELTAPDHPVDAVPGDHEQPGNIVHAQERRPTLGILCRFLTTHGRNCRRRAPRKIGA